MSQYEWETMKYPLLYVFVVLVGIDLLLLLRLFLHR